MSGSAKRVKDRRKRVLMIAERFFPEEFITSDIAKGLRERGLEFDVLTQAPSYPFGRVSAYPGYRNRFLDIGEWNGIRVYRVGTIEGYRESRWRKVLNYLHFAVLCSLVFLFIGRRYHRIFVFHSGPLTAALPALAGRKIFGTRNTIWSVDLWPDTVYMYGVKRSRRSEALLDRFVHMIYRQFETVFCSSDGFRERLEIYTGGRPVKILCQWPQVTVAKDAGAGPVLEPGCFHFTFTGNVAWTQNLENVLLGFARAAERHPEARLNIFGDGSDLERLKNMVHARGIPGVVFWGKRPLPEMPAVYRQSHVLLLSLQPDPVFERYIPLKFSTYLAFAKPVFAIMGGVVADLVERHELGKCADPSSPEAIAEGFAAWLSQPAGSLERFGERSTRLAQQQFDRERNLEVLYHTLTDDEQ